MGGCKPNVERKRFVQITLMMPVAKARCLGIILLFPVSIGRLFAPWRRSQNRCGSVRVLNPTMMGGIVGTVDLVIVMTFWYVFWNGLTFFELFKLLFSLGIDHDPPCSLCSHDLCLFPFSHVSFFTRSHGQEKSLSYYDLFMTSEY